jgi:hypothetical protein
MRDFVVFDALQQIGALRVTARRELRQHFGSHIQPSVCELSITRSMKSAQALSSNIVGVEHRPGLMHHMHHRQARRKLLFGVACALPQRVVHR